MTENENESIEAEDLIGKRLFNPDKGRGYDVVVDVSESRTRNFEGEPVVHTVLRCDAGEGVVESDANDSDRRFITRKADSIVRRVNDPDDGLEAFDVDDPIGDWGFPRAEKYAL